MNRARGQNGLFVCPCCGFATLGEVAGYEICHICFWEDDGQDDPKAEEDWGGPNNVSPVQARRNFLEFGAGESKDLTYCKKPEVSDEQVRFFSPRRDRHRKIQNITRCRTQPLTALEFIDALCIIKMFYRFRVVS